MDKKTKKRAQVLRMRLQGLRKKLAEARNQCDGPKRIAQLQASIAAAESELEFLVSSS